MNASTWGRRAAAVLAPLVATVLALVAAGPAQAATGSRTVSDRAATTAGATAPAAGLRTPVTGTAPDGTLSGVLQVTRFENRSGRLFAVGTVTGTYTRTATGASTPVRQQVAVPVTQAAAGCQVLDLVLGPVNLNLLGVVVTLNQVHLNITAQPGPGNLLGNLLCAVAGLLNGGLPLGGLSGLLNQILALLGGL